MLLVLLGKTCSGKTTIAKELEMKHGFHRIITTTSRPIRKGEKQDIDYHFITEDEFLKKINEDYFVEYKSYNTTSGTWYYGTSRYSLADLDNEKKYVIVLTPDGYRNIDVPCKSVYVYANNSTIINRLKKRKDKKDSIQRRLESDNKDFKGCENIVDHIVYNNEGEDINKVAEKILKILEG